MRPEWLWDRNISVQEVQNTLRNPQHERFVEIAALLLSRNNVPKKIFDQYLGRETFVQNWARIKRQMRKDAWNDPRIVFWQAVYEKIVSEFQERDIKIRRVHPREPAHDLIGQIAEQIKTARQRQHLTQKQLAERIGISQQIISRLEQGRDNMRILTVAKIVRSLGKEVSLELKWGNLA